jgi:hypothetical protein
MKELGYFVRIIAETIVGAGLVPALAWINRRWAGMKPAPTKHRATNLVRLRVLRPFHAVPHKEVAGRFHPSKTEKGVGVQGGPAYLTFTSLAYSQSP